MLLLYQSGRIIKRLLLSGDRIAYASAVAALMAVTLVLAGAFADDSSTASEEEVADTITVREINVVDEEGTVRFRISATKSETTLTFLGSDGKRRIQMSAVDDFGGALSFYDGASEPRIGMLGGTGISEIMLFGENRKRWMHFQASEKDGRSVIGIFDPEENPRVTVGTGPHDTGLAIYDKQENFRAVVGTTSKMKKQRPESSVAVFDETGEVIWETPE